MEDTLNYNEETGILLLEQRNRGCWYTRKAEQYYRRFSGILILLAGIVSIIVVSYAMIDTIIENVTDSTNNSKY